MEELTYKNPKLILETGQVQSGKVAWRSPSNLAIVKYWGKYGRQFPRNPSLSVTLSSAFTDTQLEYRPKEGGAKEIELNFSFHGEPNPHFEARIKTYFESLAEIFPFVRQLAFDIRSGNSFPHSSGIASSASAMSALSLALCSVEDALFGTLGEDEAFDRKASFVARLGSGSACRSIYPGMALWGETGEVPGSSDLFAIPVMDSVHSEFNQMHDDILIVSSEKKEVSSSAGHSLMDDHPYADARYQQARRHLHQLLGALRNGDWETFGRIAENEALSLHSLMMSANASYTLILPNTLEMISRIRAYRKESSNPVYFSLDAGPNIHLLYPESVMHEVRVFIEEQLLPLCEEQTMIADWIGEGPEEF